MKGRREAWTTPTVRRYGAFSDLTRQLVTVCVNKDPGASDGVHLNPTQMNDVDCS